MPEVESSMIAAIDYADGIITVTFKSGAAYPYPGTEETFKAFLTAPSKGKFFNQHLKGTDK